MADIKMTLSRDPSLRAPNIEEEKRWLEKEGRLWYPLGRYCPKKAHPGCWVYFIRGGRLVARAKAISFDPPSNTPKVSYKGVLAKQGSWEVCITSMELAKQVVLYKGFQGFRYVTDQEKRQFEEAF